jgi:hypothetical protein
VLIFKRIIVFLLVTIGGIVATIMFVGSNQDLFGLGSLCTFASFFAGFIAAAIVPNKEKENPNGENKRVD